MQGNANWGGLVKELGFQIVTRNWSHTRGTVPLVCKYLKPPSFFSFSLCLIRILSYLCNRIINTGNMKQRILIILLTLLTTMTAGAQNSSGSFGSGVTWNLDTGTKTLTFTGSGVIPDNSNSGSVPWEKTNVEHLVFDSGITRIGNQVFNDHVNLQYLFCFLSM